MRRGRGVVTPLVLLVLLLVGLAAPWSSGLAPGAVAAAPVRAGGPAAPGEVLPAAVGHHFHEADSETGRGFDVHEPFAGAVEALGGMHVTGYPASAPFRGPDACVYQLFQVLALQSCPGVPVRPANTFEMLADAGADSALAARGIGPGEPDGATSFVEAVRIRFDWLEDVPIADRYLLQCGLGDAAAAIELCGLPMNHPEFFGPFVSQRFQRIAFQRWLGPGPGGIQPGDVTAVLGGDLLKELRVVSGPALEPHPAGQPPALQLVLFPLNPSTDASRRPPPSIGIGFPIPFSVPQPGAARPPARQVVPLAPMPKARFSERATLSVLQTGVTVETARSNEPGGIRPGQSGDELGRGDIVRTDARGHALVTFYEGTTAEVLPNSALVVDRLELSPARPAQVTVRQAAGQVVHRLAKALLPGASYEVHTPSAVIVVRGTVLRMTVADDGKTEVEVFRGAVEVVAGGATIAVKANTKTEIEPGLAPSFPALNPAPPPLLNQPLVPPTAVWTALPTNTRTATATATATETPSSTSTSTPPAPRPTADAPVVVLPAPQPAASPVEVKPTAESPTFEPTVSVDGVPSSPTPTAAPTSVPTLAETRQSTPGGVPPPATSTPPPIDVTLTPEETRQGTTPVATSTPPPPTGDPTVQPSPGNLPTAVPPTPAPPPSPTSLPPPPTATEPPPATPIPVPSQTTAVTAIPNSTGVEPAALPLSAAPPPAVWP